MHVRFASEQEGGRGELCCKITGFKKINKKITCYYADINYIYSVFSHTRTHKLAKKKKKRDRTEPFQSQNNTPDASGHTHAHTSLTQRGGCRGGGGWVGGAEWGWGLRGDLLRAIMTVITSGLTLTSPS